ADVQEFGQLWYAGLGLRGVERDDFQLRHFESPVFCFWARGLDGEARKRPGRPGLRHRSRKTPRPDQGSSGLGSGCASGISGAPR
ncbi:hypothetical protein NL520_27805, partial [Klebsiella pneumoniae]|nr:hypothetical protein [Klebsiella pneumoniae]